MKTGVVIVNYNCAGFALDAALSAIGDDPQARVVIVDNASTDKSVRYFEDAFQGRLIHRSSRPAIENPAPAFAALEGISCRIKAEDDADGDAQLTVIAARRNGGFSAGCNIGLRWLRRVFDPDVIVLLNPDAVLARGAINAFRTRLTEETAGLCGASVMRFENPDCAQALGGASLHPLTLLGKNIGAGRSLGQALAAPAVERDMDYPLGAALAFRKDYLDIAGYPDERFFLYYEEADWTRRGALLRRPVWAPGAVAYHRHGAAAGSRQAGGERSALADYHMARSRMLYALKWRPYLLPALFLLSLVQSARRIRRGRWRQARAVLAGATPGVPAPAP